MGKVMSYERALQVHQEWLEKRERKKAREAERAKREEEKRKKRIAKDAELRKKREAKQAEELAKKEELASKQLQRQMRTIPTNYKKWIANDSNDGELYTLYELQHIEELYPEETGRINWREWCKSINEFKRKYN